MSHRIISGGIYLTVVAIALACAVCAFPANAAIYPFANITTNGTQNVEDQLFVDVTDAGGQASFRFYNIGPIASSITDIYFDSYNGGPLLAIAGITNMDGVAFSLGASPPNLPGGGSIPIPFVTTAGFLADADAPIAANGVNPGEEVTILFTLNNSMSINDVYNDLDYRDGDLRIGLHVQSIGASGYSDSFIHAAEPGTMLLLGSGLIGLAGWGRKKFRK